MGPSQTAPYDPSKIQIFSRSTRNWYSVEELVKRGFAAVPKSTEAPVAGDDDAATGLALVARMPIVRGGVFGLIGNSVLVTEARRLVVALGGESVLRGRRRERGEKEAAEVERAWAQWAVLVQKRVKEVKENVVFSPGGYRIGSARV